MKSRFQAIMIATTLSAGALFASSPAVTHADGVKVPETVADHAALAKEYTEKATSYKAEAERHRKMAEAYKASVATTPKAPPNPWAKKMEKHCTMLAKDADKLAADAQKAADFHTLRTKELEGK